MAALQRKLVHKQFNSPMGLYSQQNVKETLDREINAFGAQGIEIDDQISSKLANSAVLRAVEEEDEQQIKCGYKRVAWPPASEERIVREFTPQPQTQFQPVPAYQSNKQQEPGAAVPSVQGAIYNNVKQQHHQHQHPAPTNTNNFTRAPYNQNQNQYDTYPPQQPETPIVLVDKQFSRQASHEPIQTNSVPYQGQQSPMVQPQSQPMQQQHQPTYNQQIYQQQYQPNNQQNVSYPQQQQEYQQPPLLQQNSPSTPVTGWKPIQPPQPKRELVYTKPVVGANDYLPSVPYYHQQNQNYHQQPQYQQEPLQHHQQQQQQQQYHAPSHDNYQQPQYQQTPQQYSPQPQYQAPAPIQQQYQPQYQGQPQAPVTQQQYPQPPWVQQPQQPAQQQYQQPPWMQQPQQAAQQQYQQPPWMQQPQQQPPQQQYQTPLNQYQAPHQQYSPQAQPQQNQFVSQPNQQFNSYSQPQQQQHTVSHDQLDNLPQSRPQPQSLPQDYRGGSPGIITLRKEAPVTQAPAPVYTSQPAAVSFKELSADDISGGSNMRGDLKWPPPEYKEAAAKENQERRELAAGPVCRPRQVKRDYTNFFAKNALSHHYPSYKVPPGTQHMTC